MFFLLFHVYKKLLRSICDNEVDHFVKNEKYSRFELSVYTEMSNAYNLPLVEFVIPFLKLCEKRHKTFRFCLTQGHFVIFICLLDMMTCIARL